MKIFATVLATAAVLAACPSVFAAENTFISGDAHIDEQLLAASISDEIRKNCDDISVRFIRFYFESRKLENYALKQGHTKESIRAFLKSEEVIEQFTNLRDAYLSRHGVIPGDAESYCAAGRREIERNSISGNLLRAR